MIPAILVRVGLLAMLGCALMAPPARPDTITSRDDEAFLEALREAYGPKPGDAVRHYDGNSTAAKRVGPGYWSAEVLRSNSCCSPIPDRRDDAPAVVIGIYPEGSSGIDIEIGEPGGYDPWPHMPPR